MPPLNKFTTKAKEAIRKAHELAIERGQNHVNCFHMLASLLLQEESMVISEGFISVSPDSSVTVIVDTAQFARDISLQKAQEAVQAAKETIKISSEDKRELLMAEASLKRALLEIRVAQKSKKTSI